MFIQDIFEKKIDREIRGVIKVDKGIVSNENEREYRENIEKQELEEYVVTRELQGHFAKFFSNYKRSLMEETDKVGVWISGFFGSGKSHFLKTLAYLLDSKKIVDGKRAIDYFKEDNKIFDPMVIADMELSSNVPTDVILFNIDSKSISVGKAEEPLVYVFLKVFNQMQGFSSEPYIADLERKLVSEGKYDDFKNRFEESGMIWKEERDSAIFIQDELVDALSYVNFMSENAARNFCEKSTETYSISIEDFAKMVDNYLKSKGKKHRIVFFVDEIGQYIADNSRLMLNLQTITEKLGDISKGRAWIVVTSQQDIDSVTKAIKGQDFSKIQGRFDTRLSLSSANADEVIKKRILSKNETGTLSLKALYASKATSLKNKISFNDGVEKKLYSDEDNFAEVYPFIPYQFNLTGSVLTAIRTYSSSGKHMADGERSLLALFKESAMAVKNSELGTLVPFNMFYEPIKEFIDHSHSIVIKKAIDNQFINPDKTDTCFNVEVLKTLFMIKYVKEIEANIENITSLMVSNVDEDRLELKGRVEEALKVLVKQTLVQKSGSTYVFLTNEEQEINRAIDATPIESAAKTRKISELIFDDIYEMSKYKLPELNGRYSFAFNQFVDEVSFKNNQNYPISLKVITPISDIASDDSTTLRLISGQENSVLVVLPDDRAFIDEITLALQIEKFITNGGNLNTDKYSSIINDKRAELRDHNNNSKIYLEESLKNADIYVNGELLKTSAKEITSRINEALGKLVKNIYHKLSYIDTPVGESDIYNIFKSDRQLTLDVSVSNPNINALTDMKNYVTLEASKHTKISLKTILNHFLAAPYGFVEVDIQWLVAKQFKSGVLAFWLNNEPVTLVNHTPQEIIKYITRKEYLEKLMIEPKQVVGEKYKKAAKEVSKELFSLTISVDDDDDKIMADFCKRAESLKTDINILLAKYDSGVAYPGKMLLKDGIKLLNEVLQTTYANEFFAIVYNKKDDFLDFAEDIAPVKSFFATEQLNIFNKALKYLDIYNKSKTYIFDVEIESLAVDISAIVSNSKPYALIYKLPAMLDKFAELNVALISKEAEPVKTEVEFCRTAVFDYLNSVQVVHYDKLKNSFISRFDELREKTKTCNDLASLKNIPIESDTLKLRCINEINADIKQPEPSPISAPISNNVIKRKSISMKQLNSGVALEIRNADDVDKYINELKKQLLNEIEDNTILRIEF